MKIEKQIEIPGYKGKNITIDYRYFVSNSLLIPVIYVHGYKGFKDWGPSNIIADTFSKKNFLFLKFNFSHNGVLKYNPHEFSDLEAFGNNNYFIEIEELQLVIDWLERTNLPINFSKLSIIGHSRGGGISLLQSARDNRIKKVITWASVFDFSGRFPEDKSTWKTNGVHYVLNGRTKQMMPLYYQFYTSFLNNKKVLDIPNQCKNINQEVMIIHGTEDKSVLFSEAELLHSQITNSVLLPIYQADHTFGARHPFKDQYINKWLNQVIEASISFLTIFILL